LAGRGLPDTGLEDLAHDDVLDVGRVDPGPHDRVADGVAAQRGRDQGGQGTPEPPEGRARGRKDDGSGLHIP